MISGIVLAAGTSSRFGTTKQLSDLGGKPLVLHVIDAARDAGLDEVVVVTGHDAKRVEAILPAEVRVVRNPQFEEGQGSSLGAGLHALNEASDGAVVLMADQPGVTADDIRGLIEAFLARRSRIVRIRYADGPGPALLSREIYGQSGHLHGDAGARQLIAAHPEWVEEVEVDTAAPRDVDTPADLQRIREA